ncbi:immunoglobulin-like domain-containing protein [Paenibacillus mesotrionivorans]|uniref:Immunoglobulin-like domain-containing protein n=1 Tax=Paenibacillus mesotrionivorans TaxID=3160968 RepID=A0ACC7P376_9BACL
MKKKQTLGSRLCALAMVAVLLAGLFQSVLPPQKASAAAPETVYAAAYTGATSTAGTSLPTAIELGGVQSAVTWFIGADTFAIPYDIATVTGAAANGTTVMANVVVLPPQSSPLVYFVDSGTGPDWANPPLGTDKKPVIRSLFYEAVTQLNGVHLANEVSDQIFNMTGEPNNTWGAVVGLRANSTRTDPLQSPDGAAAGDSTDLYRIGLRTGNNSISYKLTLAPGKYTLTSGFFDWYGTRSRETKPRIDYTDTSGTVKTLQLDQYNTNATTQISSEFTLPADANASVPVTLTYANVSGEAPILSWFSVAQGGIKTMIEDARKAAASMVKVLLDGNDIKADNVNGLTFKGFGVLSANSTSALLMDYKAEHPDKYTELLQVLFGGEHPLMSHVKIEMGNDRNNSTGPDPATMRTADEPANVTRHPGFQLAADAKAVNPNVKVSILRWSAPAWADNNDKIYTWYKNTLLAAYREYGYMADYVNPYINEHAPDLNWTREYAAKVRNDAEGFLNAEEKALYNRMEMVISDEVGIGSFGGSLVSDATLRDVISVAGYHYNTDDDSAGNFKKLAEQYDLEIWNSEAQATFSNSAFRPHNNVKDPSAAGTGIGGTGSALEMGNTIIKGFVNSRRTHFIYQPAIGSFYEGGQYSFKELVSARDPWSGWIHYDAGLAVLQHFNWFMKAGWENETNTAGIWRAVPQASYTGATGTNPVSGRNGTPSYMTMAAPDKSNFSTVIVNDSEYERTYKLQTVNMAFSAGKPPLEVWETRAAEAGEAFNSRYMQYLEEAAADGAGVYTVKVKPYSVVTVTSLDNDSNPAYRKALPVEGERTVLDTDATGAGQNTSDNILYADNFDYTSRTVPVIGAGGLVTGSQSYVDSRGGPKGAIPRYTHDRNGAFEAYLDETTGNYVLRQQLDRSSMGLGGTWNNGEPVTAIGDNRWMNYRASVDVSFENNSTQGGANYAAIGARYQGGGSSHSITGTPYVLKFWFDGGWQLLVNNVQVANGNAASGEGGVRIEGFNTAHNAWHKLAIEAAGSQITAYLDGVKLATYTDPSPKLSGRVDLASGYYFTCFDNLVVEKLDGYEPYYAELLDNLEMTDLAPVPQQKLVYNGSWNHTNGQGMYIYQRSISASQGTGAALSYTFTGTGLDLLGPNDGTAKLEVTVDGLTVAKAAPTLASKELYQTYSLRGLKYGPHTVEVKVVSGNLSVDAVAVVPGLTHGAPDTTALQTASTSAQAVTRQPEFTEADWQRFEALRAEAGEALADPAAYRLDQEGAEQLAARLTAAEQQLYMGDIISLATPFYAATYTGTAPALPQTVEAKHQDGTTSMVKVDWKLQDTAFATPYETVSVKGTYGNLETTAYVEVVPPGLVYFVDTGVTVDGDTPPYTLIKSLVGETLLNNKADQPSTGDSVWGHTPANSNYQMKGLGGAVVATDKGQTGVYGSNTRNNPLGYVFPLTAGKYTITSFHRDWWSNTNRTMDISLSYMDAQGATVTEPVRTGLVAGSGGVSVSHSFTLPVDGTVKLSINNTYSGNQASLVSYVAVAKRVPSPADVQAVQEAKSILEGAAYTVERTAANTEEDVRTWLRQTMSGLPGFAATGVTAGEIAFTSFQAASGTAPGSFSFTVALSKGEAEASAAANGVIKAPVVDTSRTTQAYAAYAGTLPQLPQLVRLADGGPEYPVTRWTTDGSTLVTAADFDTPFETIPVSGAYNDGSGDKQFQAYVEVIPPGLKYFIDAGASAPVIYEAVSKLAGGTLLNGSANQLYSEGSGSGWGYTTLSSTGAVKPIINKSAQPDLDKHATGIMIDGGDPLSTLTYRLGGLEGGKSYRFTSYHRLWWDNEMPLKIAVEYSLNGKTVSQLVNRLHLDHAGHSRQVEYSLNLPVGASDVRYVLTNVGSYTAGPGAGKTNKNAAISWLAVEELAAPAQPSVYTTLGGVAGENTDVWLDTNGVPIQAHGGQVTWVEHITWDGDKPSYTASPAQGDGAWLWVGEDKTYGGRPIGGIHTYVSKDLYNWVDMGVALYPHRMFPMEKTADGTGVQLSSTRLAELKARAMAASGVGLNERGQPLTQADIDGARDFLQAYVDRNTHPGYSRSADADFDYVAASYDDASLKLAFDRTYAYYTIMERPKMLYNEQTGKYVIVYHADGPTDARILEQFDTLVSDPMYNTGISRYSRAQMGFAVSDTPFGPFKLVNAQKMNYIEGYYDSNKGMARDMTVFQDDDGKAYAIYSSEENKYTYVSLLNETYTAPAQDGTSGFGETFTARVFPDASREAPAVFKYDGYYYFITSGTTGWDPNPSIAYRANHIFGNTEDGGKTFTPYTKLGNPFPNDSSNTSYRTQSTAVIPYDAENGLFIYMGDRWIQRALETSGYAWVPLRITSNGTQIEGQTLSNWTLDVLDGYSPLKVLTTINNTFRLGEALELPLTLDVQKGKTVYRDIPVIWDAASLEAARLTVGAAAVKGTLGGILAGSRVDVEVTVALPDNLQYFVNPASGDVPQYTQLMEAYKTSTGKVLRHEAAEQVYDPAAGKTWGYSGNNSTLRVNTADIFQSLRYVNSSSERNLTYKFDLEKGDYTVYMGFYDPWFSSSQSKRAANTVINGVTVESGRIINASYAVAEHKGIVMNEDGTMEIMVAPANSGSNTDVQLSWIMITQTPGADAVKPVITLLGEDPAYVNQGAVYTDAGATALDNRDGNITDRISTTYSWNGLPAAGVSTVTEATYKVHYNVSDTAGNLAAEVTRTVVVKAPPTEPDTVKPQITLLGHELVTLGVGAEYTDAGAIAMDDRDGDITDRIITSYSWNGLPAAEVSTVTEATYTVHYNVSDLAGNRANEVTRTVVVATYGGPDVVKPVITLLGDAAITLENGAVYLDPGALAADDRDGSITDRLVTTISFEGKPVTAVNTLAAGTYTIHYNVQDAAGNAAEEKTREVIVKTPPILPDTVKPVITLKGNKTVYAGHGSGYQDEGAAATDDRDGNITERIVTTITFGGKPVSALNTFVAGTYTIHYNVQDAAGNAAEEMTREVIVYAAVVDSGGENNTDTVTAPVPAPEVPVNTQQVDLDDLKTDGQGTYSVQWNMEAEALLLPAQLANTVGAGEILKLVKEQTVLTLSGQTLQKLLAQAAEGQEARVKITAVTGDSRSLNQAMEAAALPAGVQWKAAGGLYSIRLEAVAANGEAFAIAPALSNETVQLSIPTGPAADSELLGMYGIGADGKAVYLGGQWKNGELTATVPLSGQYAVLAYERSFSDVDSSHWAKTVITRMAAKHVINGVDDTRFEPQGSVTRAEFAAMLVRLLAIQPAGGKTAAAFSDVPQDAWYADAVAAAAQAGLVTGRSAGGFEPDGTITRQEMAVMLIRALEWKTGRKPASQPDISFTDSSQIGDWAKDAVSAAGAAGLLQGRENGQFAPQEQLTRAESVQVLYNLLKNVE